MQFHIWFQGGGEFYIVCDECFRETKHLQWSKCTHTSAQTMIRASELLIIFSSNEICEFHDQEFGNGGPVRTRIVDGEITFVADEEDSQRVILHDAPQENYGLRRIRKHKQVMNWIFTPTH